MTILPNGRFVFLDVIPDPDEGRRLLREELKKSIYHKQKSWLQTLWEKISDSLPQPSSTLEHPSLLWVATALLVVVCVIVVLLLVTGLPRRDRKAVTQASPDSVVFDDNRSAIQYLAAAKGALERNDFTTAFLEHFRHLLKRCETQGLLYITPGMTALEGTNLLAEKSPACREQLNWAALTFNSLKYGRRDTTRDQVQRLIALASFFEKPNHSASNNSISAFYVGSEVSR